MDRDNNPMYSEDPRNKLDDLLEESKAQGKRLVEYGQDFTETGQYIADLSSAMQDVLHSANRAIDVEPLIHDWNISNDHMSQALSRLDAVDVSAVNSTAGTMSVSSGLAIDPEQRRLRSIMPDSEEIEGSYINLANVISRHANEEEVLRLLSELDFDQKIGDRESPRDRFRFAHEAYKKPVSAGNPAVTSLIPMREAIRGVISELLKRRPNQERARNEHDKIISIGNQLVRDSISMDLVESWAQQWINILNELSQAKEKEISRTEWLHQLRQATSFLMNLLRGLDPDKFRE